MRLLAITAASILLCLGINNTASVASLSESHRQTRSVLKWKRIGSIPDSLLWSNGGENVRSSVLDPISGLFIFFDGKRTYSWSGHGTWKNFGIAEPAQQYYVRELGKFFPLPNGIRANSRLIRHPNSGKILLFGGEIVDSNQTGNLDDIWEWDGTNWRLYGSDPYTRSLVNYIVDESSGQGLFYGGSQDDGFNGGPGLTWTYDGTNFMPVESASPPWRFLTSMTFDPLRKRVVLYGGFEQPRYTDGWTGQWHAITGTWEWDGIHWLHVRNGGPRVGGHTITYDPDLGASVLIGGANTEMIKHKHEPPSFVTKLNDRVYTWKGGKKWERLEIENPLPPRYGHWAFYSKKFGGIVLFGGTDGTKNYKGIYLLKMHKK